MRKEKKRNKKFVALLLMFAALTFAVPAVYARHSGEWGHESCGIYDGLEGKFFFKAHYLLGHADEIGLTEEQQTNIRDLKIELKKNLIRQEAEIEVMKLDIDHLIRQDSIDTEAVKGLMDQKYELKKAKSIKVVEAMTELKKLINAEQHAKMKELLKGKHETKED